MDSILEQARTFFSRGIEYFEGGQLEQARSAFASALALAPGRPSVLGNLGITLFHLGRLDEAVPLLQQATDADPAYLEAWTCLALAQQARSQWQDAVAALEKASGLAPQQPQLWVRKGQCLLRLGRVQEALQAYDQALVIAPTCVEAWSERGNLMRELAQLDEAAKCFEQALALGGDPELHAYYLASVKGTPAPPAPRRYVEALFDDYAADFQSHVINQLRYEGHARLLQPLLLAQRRFHRALDLGCGTGLCGALIHPLVDRLDGVDISQSMLQQARRLEIYNELVHADLGVFLESAEQAADLVIAADVFIYVGDLAKIFSSIRRVLAAGGCFVFTVEVADGDQDVQLLPSLRYAHSERYIRQLSKASGFHVDDIVYATIRYDQAQPVAGMYVYLRTCSVSFGHSQQAAQTGLAA
jgi:predicted TPR repeat methyltransferase